MNLHCPYFIRKFAELTKDLFQDLNGCAYYLTLKMLFSYFIFQYDSVSDLLRKNSWTMSESHFLRLILAFDGNRLMRRMRRSIIARYKGNLDPDKFVLAIDDTDNPKYSNYLSHVQVWKGSKGYFTGQKVLVIALVDIESGFALPLNFRINIPKDNQKKSQSAIDFAYQLGVNAANDFPKIPIVADSWFDSEDLAKKFRKAGITYVWELKSNRKCKEKPGRSQQWIDLESAFKNLPRFIVDIEKNKWISESLLVLKSKKTQIKVVSAFNRKNAKSPFAFYASTERTMPGARVWKIFRERWKIECLFFDLKNHLNFGRLSVSDDKANELAFVIPFVIITYLRINPGAFNLKKGMTVAKMTKTLITNQENLTIDQLLTGKFKDQIENLKNRRLNICKKPVVQRREGKCAA